MKKFFGPAVKLFLVAICLFSYSLALATPPKIDEPGTGPIMSAYQKYSDVSFSNIVTPTVVELALPNNLTNSSGFLVYDKEAHYFTPALFLSTVNKTGLSIDIVSNGVSILGEENLLDNNNNTFVDIPLVGDGYNTTEITITASKDISSDSLITILDNFVALPNTISIKTIEASGQKTVLAETKMLSPVINFPVVSAKKWLITFRYSQPLRLVELSLEEKNNNLVPQNKLRFLAQPRHTYQLYFLADRVTKLELDESANLSDNRDIQSASLVKVMDNPGFIVSDGDSDGVPDMQDNCVKVANPDQADINQNGRGDVCDDFDKDGVINSKDNCRDLPNYNQADTDGDKIGDVCDGEESRITEKYAWIPWLGIGLAILVVVGLFALTALSMSKKEDVPPLN